MNQTNGAAVKQIIVLLVAASLLAGCSSDNQPTPIPTPTPTSGPTAALELVNMWTVTGTEANGAVYLRLAPHEVTVWSECGTDFGTWASDGSLFLADIFGGIGKGRCRETYGEEPALPLRWLHDATSFTVTNEGIDLVDAGGTTVARLTAGGSPPPSRNLIDTYLSPPEVTPDVIEQFGRAAELTSAVAPPADIVGLWLPIGFGLALTGEPEGPFVQFTEGGTWNGSDGCNLSGGRWVLAERGVFLSTSRGTTLMACKGSGAPYWLSQATRVGMVANDLVLYDASGAALGELVPA
jgi:heat shock protein HslJ